MAKILPVKIMGPHGDFSERAAVAGTMFAIRSGARVLNLSWGGYQVSIGGMQAALAAAARRDKLVVIAAGNNGADLDGGAESPDSAGYRTSITVAEPDVAERVAPDSNFGRFRVQIAAPGSGIEGDYPSRWYGGGSGTSFAAPQVSGVAALLFSVYPSATAAQVRRAMLVGGRKLPQLRGKVECGCLLDARGALAAMATPDGARPSAFRVTTARHGSRLRLRWTAARDAELEGYKLIVDGSMRAAFPPSRHGATLQLPGRRHTGSSSPTTSRATRRRLRAARPERFDPVEIPAAERPCPRRRDVADRRVLTAACQDERTERELTSAASGVKVGAAEPENEPVRSSPERDPAERLVSARVQPVACVGDEPPVDVQAQPIPERTADPHAVAAGCGKRDLLRDRAAVRRNQVPAGVALPAFRERCARELDHDRGSARRRSQAAAGPASAARRITSEHGGIAAGWTSSPSGRWARIVGAAIGTLPDVVPAAPADEPVDRRRPALARRAGEHERPVHEDPSELEPVEVGVACPWRAPGRRGAGSAGAGGPTRPRDRGCEEVPDPYGSTSVISAGPCPANRAPMLCSSAIRPAGASHAFEYDRPFDHSTPNGDRGADHRGLDPAPALEQRRRAGDARSDERGRRLGHRLAVHPWRAEAHVVERDDEYEPAGAGGEVERDSERPAAPAQARDPR